MTLPTGTSKSGQVHKDYACSTCARQGKTACRGRSIQMAKLDSLVTEHLVDRILHPQRLTAILASIVARRSERAMEIDGRRAALQTAVADADERLKRLYEMMEGGLTDFDEVPRKRLASLKFDRDRAMVALDRIKAQAAYQPEFDPAAVESFGRMMRENVTAGSVPFRKAYIRSVVDRIEVDDEVICIIRDKAKLEQAGTGWSMAHAGVRFVQRIGALGETRTRGRPIRSLVRTVDFIDVRYRDRKTPSHIPPNSWGHRWTALPVWNRLR